MRLLEITKDQGDNGVRDNIYCHSLQQINEIHVVTE